MSVPFGSADEHTQKNLEALASELAKHIKSEQDIAALSRQLLKLTVEMALGAEMEAHLGYGKYAPEGQGSGNSRNGYSPKTLKGDMGEVEIRTPRDRNGRFEPQLIGKGQTRLSEFDDQILALYARGVSTRDIASVFLERYGALPTAWSPKSPKRSGRRFKPGNSAPWMRSIRSFTWMDWWSKSIRITG